MLRQLASCILSLVLIAPVNAPGAPPVTLAGTQRYDLKGDPHLSVARRAVSRQHLDVAGLTMLAVAERTCHHRLT